MLKRILFILPFAVLLLGLISWRLHAKQSDLADQAKLTKARKNAPANVTTATAQQKDIVLTYEAVGSVESPFNVKLASKIAGRIDYLQVREGDRVKAGQLLVRIDPSEIRGQVNQAQADVAQAESRLAQAQLTNNANTVSIRSQISQQRAALASAQANYNQVKQNYAAQVAAAQSAVTDSQGKVNAARATIDSAKAGINSAQANLANDQAIYNRTYGLYKQGFVAAQDVDNAQAQLAVQKATLDAANQQLRGSQSQLDSAVAEMKSAQNQADITIVKGKADIEAALQTVNQAKAALSLALANTSQEPAYQANLRALQSAVISAQGQLQNAQAQFVNTELRSSIDGSVTARYADPGSTATVGTALLNIVALGDVYVTSSVPEETAPLLKTGQTGDVVFDALPGHLYAGKITQINPAADPQTRQFMVRITLINPDNLIKPGMFAHVTFVTLRIPGALVVPREAIKTGKDGTYVAVVDDQGIAHTRPVKTGQDDGKDIQVLSGLTSGEQVVTLSYQPVRDGQAVKSATSQQNAGS